MRKVLDYLDENKDCPVVCQVVASLCKKIHTCLLAGRRIARPSTAQGVIWSRFHQLRCSELLKQLWRKIKFPDTLIEFDLGLQIISDRLLNQMITKETPIPQSTQETRPSLTTREKNAVRYMAGYVAITLIRRYSKTSRK